MSQIFAIHPADSNLKFFEKLIKVLQKQQNVTYIHLGPSDSYHNNLITTFENSAPSTLLFFCHGEDKSLRGCNRESSLRRPYNYSGSLISPSKNIAIFLNKNVFCMACHSKTLGKYAINAGAKVFLGFGEIHFHEQQAKSSRVINITKFELRKLLESALTVAIENNYSFNDLSILLRRSINKKRNELLLGKGYPDPFVRNEVAKILGKMKNSIVMFGNGNTLVH